MNAIRNLARTAFWTYRNYILPATTLIIPAAIEAINLTAKLYNDPGALKLKFESFKEKVIRSFSKRSFESHKEYYNRLQRKVVKIATAVLCGAAVTTLFYTKLAPEIATPLSIASIALVGKGYSTLSKIPSKKEIIHFLKDGFYQRFDETDFDYRKRRASTIKTIVKVSCVGLFLCAGIGFGGYVTSLLTKVQSVWRVYDVLPKQTNAVVTLEYSILGIIHALFALNNHFKDRKSQILVHSLAAIASVLFPFGYMIVAKPGESIRIHHSFLGLFLQLFEWRALQFFGMVITFDSSLYFISSERGYDKNGEFHSYDYQNSVVNNFAFVLNSLTYLCLAESAVKQIFNQNKDREEDLYIDLNAFNEDELPIALNNV